MTPTLQNADFLNDLERTAKIRDRIATHLGTIAKTLEKAELDSADGSGQMNLEREIEDARRASHNLQRGTFRLLVLGDMKRGKSTFLNALIGENLLPSDVNPCTALLTILRYGADKKVTVHFIDQKSPEELSFDDFKQRYTIDPTEAKQFEQRREQAFPNVSHAVVEYPLPLLERGVEIVDSPGLNDTEARNEMSLNFIGNCHAILFVMRASQPCTLGERRYLENYIKDRGLSIFFLINAWDQVKESLIDPDDQAELNAAESRLRQVFAATLEDYCKVDGYDLYDERVFEVSALQALRKRIKDTDANLDGTGFPKFIAALNTFLTQERAVAELRQARTLGRQAASRMQDSISRRLPLLEQDVEELGDRIKSVEPEFKRFSNIRDTFRNEILEMRDEKSRAIADSFKTYILKLEDTFETEFPRYQPPQLGWLDALNQGRKEEFSRELEKAFQQYLNDKFSAWGIKAERELKESFQALGRKAEVHGNAYQAIADVMHEKLTGQSVTANPKLKVDGGLGSDNSPGWAKWAMGLFSLATGNWAGAALAVAGFDFNSLALNIFTAGAIAVIVSTFFGIMLGPLAFALVGLGVGALQAGEARDRINKALKAELVKHLPTVAQEQWQPIYTAVRECFEKYEQEVMSRIDDDIKSRQDELDNLLAQKQKREIDQKSERERLESISEKVTTACEEIEEAYQALLV